MHTHTHTHTHTHAHTHTHTHTHTYTHTSHYVVYAVVADELGNTFDVDESAENVYITAAGPQTGPPFFLIMGGDGIIQQYTVENGLSILYRNKAIQRGRNYSFFVRLYSSAVGDGSERERGRERLRVNILLPLQDLRTFNDSSPQNSSSS